MILFLLSRERDEALIVAEGLTLGPVGPCFKTSRSTEEKKREGLGISHPTGCPLTLTINKKIQKKNVISTNGLRVIPFPNTTHIRVQVD
ncbi:hypothetical protein TNCV_3177591 [Trichonephila clavipes]|nr:hypothetical protein TNCV_3177591 [Trichonephila clavipes]